MSPRLSRFVLIALFLVTLTEGAFAQWIPAGPDPRSNRRTGPWKPKERAALFLEVIEIHRGVPTKEQQDRIDLIRQRIGRESDDVDRARLQRQIDLMLRSIQQSGDWVLIGVPGEEPRVHDIMISLRVKRSLQRGMRDLSLGDIVTTVEPEIEDGYGAAWGARYLVNKTTRPRWWRAAPVTIQTGTSHPVFDSRWKQEFEYEQPLSPAAAPLELTDLVQQASEAVLLIRTLDSAGTAFFVNADGVAITNKHVVEDYATFDAVLPTGQIVQGTVIGVAQDADLALVQVPGTGHSYLRLNPTTPRLGEDVVVVGNAEDMGLSVTRGIVSGIREIKSLDALQTDAAINPGNSGGPVLDLDGSVVGIATWILDGAEGMGFAILTQEVLDRTPLIPHIP